MKNKKGKNSKVQRKTIPIPKNAPLPKEPSITYTQLPKRGKYVKPKATKPKKRKE